MRHIQWLSAALGIALMGACDAPQTGGDGGHPDAQVVRADAATDSGGVSVCERASDCDDGQFCNGVERCEPGAAGAGPDGCAPTEAVPCSETEVCDETAEECHTDDCADGGDADGDGDPREGCGGHDCDDDDGSVYSTAQEVCGGNGDDFDFEAAGRDEDCDPSTIYNDAIGANDGDRDGDGAIDLRCFNVNDDGSENRGTDCDDMRATINPAGVEACDHRDNDCDDMIDEGQLDTYYHDADGDNYGDSSMTLTDCSAPDGYVLAGGDCDDTTGTISPGVTEACDGVVDQDCDGLADLDDGCTCVPEGATQPCAGALGACAAGNQTCGGMAGWGECSIIGVPEECDGSSDDDCDGVIDEGCGCVNMTTRSCGLGACAGIQTCVGGAWGSCIDATPGDGSPSTELCNGVDDDCNGTLDDVANLGSVCGSSAGICSPGTLQCVGGSTSPVCGGPEYVPPVTETCDHVDNDCDGSIDDGVAISSMCSRTFPPTDSCGFGTCPRYLCLPRAGSDYCAGGLATGVNAGESPHAAYAQWSGDFGRANYFRARVNLRDTSNDGLEPDGWVSFVILPHREIGADSGGGGLFQPGGLPVLGSGEQGVALSLSGNGYAVTLWRYRGSYWDIVDTTPMPASCSPVSTTQYGYTFEIINDGGHFIARVSRNGCGTATLDLTPAGLWDDLYGSGPTPPRYNLGVIGDNDDNLYISVYEMYMQRRLHLGDRNDCDGCS